MIGMAEQKGSYVYAYDERGTIIFTKSGQLMGYTSSTVAVKQGSTTFVFDEKGTLKFTK